MEIMIAYKAYNRERAVEYARRWAFSRNPLFYNFTGIGGDCTNFVSQALLAGSCVMNYTPDIGWYYLSPQNRAAAWTGVEYFYNFITANDGVGPFGRVISPDMSEVGDVIQLGNNNDGFYHTLIIVGYDGDDPLVAAQTNNALRRPLSSYEYDFSRFIKIDGIRMEIPDMPDCFASVLDGTSL